MILLVTGGRDYADREKVFRVLDEIHAVTPIALVIHGACGWDRDKMNGLYTMLGADRWADEWAEQRSSFRRVAARWGALGGKAGPLRNAEMVAMGPDLVVAFPGGRGTADCVRQAKKAGVEVRVIE